MNLIDIFCGTGGMSLGFEMAGFNSILAIDKWHDAILTYNANRPYKVGTTKDIHEFSNEDLERFKQLGKISGIIGGPPCQGFSLVGTRSKNDPRNSLYIEFTRFVEVIKPDFFVLENVPGLLSLDKGSYKKDIIKTFSEIGYNVSYQLLRASDYGVPQSRQRVFFVGLKRDVFNSVFFDFGKLEKISPISSKDAISDLPLLGNELMSLNYETEPQNEYQKLMRHGSRIVNNHEKTQHTQKTIDVISLVPDGGNIRDLPEEFYKIRNYNNAFRRMNSNLPSNTIDCGHRNYFHYSENRIPTVRESARLQSFPDTYVFHGSRTSQYTQVGNAVPPILAYNIAKEIFGLIKTKEGKSNGNP